MSRAQDLFDRLVQGGTNAVGQFIDDAVSEELFLDYKRSADNGGGQSLNNKDRANLAKAISGFGNSEGGVIVWGVECRNDRELGDVPSKAVHIQNPTRFKSWLEQATTGLTVPAHESVRHHAIDDGFVVTLIPSGLSAPYQTVPDLSYYIRSGSNFAKTPHAVLAGMFGRRPQPSIKNHFLVPATPTLVSPGVVKTSIGILLRNFGRGMAEDVFLNLSVKSDPGDYCSITMEISQEHQVWQGRKVLNQVQMMTKAGYRLPPEADLMPLTVEICLQNPIERDFKFEGLCGSTGGEATRFCFEVDILSIRNAIDPFLKVSETFADTPVVEAAMEISSRKFNQIFFRRIPNA